MCSLKLASSIIGPYLHESRVALVLLLDFPNALLTKSAGLFTTTEVTKPETEHLFKGRGGVLTFSVASKAKSRQNPIAKLCNGVFPMPGFSKKNTIQ